MSLTPTFGGFGSWAVAQVIQDLTRTRGAAYQHALLGKIALDLITYFEGMEFKFGADYAEHALIEGNALGTKSLKQYDATGAKVAAVIAANQLADVEYDGTDFVLLDPLPSGLKSANLIGLSGDRTLTVAHVGATLTTNYASAQTWTLPLANAVSAGSRIEFACFGTGVLTIQRAGTDGIVSWAGAGTNALLIGNGDVLSLESNGGSLWYVVSSTVRARACSVALSASFSIPASSSAKILYDILEFDPPGVWDTTNKRFFAKFPGKYRISGSGFVAAVSTAGSIFHEVRKNGVMTNGKRGTEVLGQGANSTLVFDAMFDLLIGDYLEVVIYNTAPVSQTYGPPSGVNTCCYAQCEYLGY